MSCIIDASASSGLIGSGGVVWLYPSQTIANNNIEAANAIRGDGRIHAHQPCFTGSAAILARTRTSNAADGSTIGNSLSKSLTDRNSFTRTRHVVQAARCFSISARSLSFSRPSTYPSIRLSMFVQLIIPILLDQKRNLFSKLLSFSNSPTRLYFVPLYFFTFLLLRSRHQRRQLHSQHLVGSKQKRLQRALRTT